MSLELDAVIVRHERRLRLLFTGPVGAGAFAPALYALDADGGAAPRIVGALLVAGAPAVVELALGADLAAGVRYVLHAAGVPASGGAATSVDASFAFRWDSGEPAPDAEIPEDDLGALLYGIDLLWTGSDFGETALGDLATVQGPDNAKGALLRRLTAEDDLPWSPGYAAGARDYVDGPQLDATTLRGSILRSARADDRVRRVVAVFHFDEEGSGDASFDVTVDLVGAESFAVKVPVTPGG